MTVFHRDKDGTIRLTWASELLFEPLMEPDQDPRHLGTVEPYWGFLDLTPRGRPKTDHYRDHASRGRLLRRTRFPGRKRVN